MAIRTTFYIDGFNFYNGLKSAMQADNIWRKYYWLDFVQFANQFVSKNQELVSVKYFTASPLQHDKESRQSALFKSNKFLNGEKVEIIKGKYLKKKIRCKAECGKRFLIYEEKRTDVNISVEIMGDCALNRTDYLVLVSADSDLIPTIEYVLLHWPEKRLKVFFPPCRRSNDIIKTMNSRVEFLDKGINKKKFEKSVMPGLVTDENGNSVAIPDKWIYKP